MFRSGRNFRYLLKQRSNPLFKQTLIPKSLFIFMCILQVVPLTLMHDDTLLNRPMCYNVNFFHVIS